MAVHFVANKDEIEEGVGKIVTVEGRSIGLYRIGDDFYALHNRCPHEGAPLCRGQVCGTTLPSSVYQYEFGRKGELVRCPWHGWEFDIRTGKSLFDEKVRTRSYPVQVVDGKVGVIL